MLSFYDGFFLNLCVLITALFVYKELVKKSNFEIQTVSTAILNGLLGGLLAAVLMYFSIETGTNSMIDLRIIPFMLVILYGNWLATSITATLIIFIRFMIGVNIYSFYNIIFILASWMVFRYFFKKIKNRWVSIIVMLTLSNIVYTVLIIIISAGEGLNLLLISTYWIICILGGLVSVYIMDYLNETEMIFKRNSKYAFKDPLTGLNNVRSFDLAFNEAKRRHEKSNENISIMILDVDYFKQINDTYGHLEGDLVLGKLATILEMSQNPNDTISRNGGEEFSVLLNDCNHKEAYEKADALRKIVENSFFAVNNGTIIIHVTISVGITTYNDTTIVFDKLYDHADQALYAAKRSGRNKVCSYSQVTDPISN
ncbi:GGDEF domain-containing protein [Carnobacterium pleistocenium]|uniref:GGDEF domain-containing protein n=1 Tax=Carnobacterium pleistocenium TaxID=181073 RepID=UPI000551EC6D|nr:diguanylate cyclase [Carnobacterium pleistocenium]